MNFLEQHFGPLPLWGWGVVIGGAILAAWYIRNRITGSSSSSSGTLGQNGQNQPQYDYSGIDPNTGVPYSVEEGTDPNTGQPYYYEYPGGNPPSGGSTTPTVTIRQKQSSGPFANYDKSHVGVPVQSSPQQSGSPSGVAPYGSQVQTSGQPVTGGSDNGSTLWYPISGGGYISSVDVSNSSGGGVAATTTTSGAPSGTSTRVRAVQTQATPWWPIDMTTAGRY